ncbi:MAG: hypothetical protein IT290_08240 [Deltaproteobacteria bacterium]|nr:hypothetical protein [Deltaproteobacteria bacterium]
MIPKKIDAAELRHELCAFVADNRQDGDGPVDEDTPLSEAGIDSFTLLEILLFLERKYEARLPLELLTRENTRSIATLTDCYLDFLERNGAKSAANG